MKTIRLLLPALFCAICLVSRAQATIAGIYLSAADFTTHRLAFTGAPGSRCHIRLHDFFFKPYITVACGKMRRSFPKDSVFGFVTPEQEVYHFYNGRLYQLVNNGDIPLLYKQVKTAGKSAQPVVTWYFSKDASSPLRPLTRENICNAFAADTAFVEQVYEDFAGDDELLLRQTYQGPYRINAAFRKLHRQQGPMGFK